MGRGGVQGIHSNRKRKLFKLSKHFHLFFAFESFESFEGVNYCRDYGNSGDFFDQRRMFSKNEPGKRFWPFWRFCAGKTLELRNLFAMPLETSGGRQHDPIRMLLKFKTGTFLVSIREISQNYWRILVKRISNFLENQLKKFEIESHLSESSKIYSYYIMKLKIPLETSTVT